MSGETFEIVSGLPFSKEIRVSLPPGRTWWTNTSEFEVLMQVRKDKKRDSELILDLAQYLDVTMSDADTIKVMFSMGGHDTRGLHASGFFDMILSDVGTTDDRAFVVLYGTVKRSSVITAEVEGQV